MVAISSPGLGSNLDVNGILKQLMAVESQPLTVLDRKEAGFQAKLSAYGNVKSALATFQTAVRGLSDLPKFQTLKAIPSDATIYTASANSTAVAGSYSLEVTKLAAAQKLVTTGQASSTASVGNGTLTFDFGTISGGTFSAVTGKYTGAAFATNGSGVKTVTINSTNNTLAGIRDAVNSAKIGVTATIVNDGGTSPYRLALTSNNIGSTNSIKIAVSGDTALSTLLAHDPAATQNLAETVTAQNAELKVDGVAISKTSNTVSDVIQGVTLNLLKTNTGSANTLTVTRDTGLVKSSVETFVKTYNELNKTLSELSAYNATTKQAALLQGESAVRSIQAQIRNTLTSSLTGVSGVYTSLTSIGVSFQKDGTLAVDSTKLQTAIDTNFNDIANVFAAVGKPTDSLVNYVSSTVKTQAGAYALTISQLATQGKATGSVVANTTITAASNDALNVTIDGVSATVTLSAGTYTATTLAAEVQSKINGASAFSSQGIAIAVTQSGGVLTMTSNRYGTASIVDITGGNGVTGLMGTPAETAGVNVAGTINGLTGTGSGQYLTGGAGSVVEGLKLQITGGVTGSRGTVNYSQGYAYKLDKLAESLLGTSGPVASRTKSIDSSIEDVNDRREVLNRRLAETEKRYRAQFVALDGLISGLRATSDFLTQQLANLPKPGG